MKIVAIHSGMGNQMLHYALYRELQTRGETVFLDSSWGSVPPRDFRIAIFPQIEAHGLKRNLALAGNRGDGNTFPFYTKANWKLHAFAAKVGQKIGAVYYENWDADFDENVFSTKAPYLFGYFLNEKYFISVAPQLRKEFAFPLGEEKLEKLIKQTEQEEFVGIHFRRGGFLDAKVRHIIGDICDEAYYKAAIDKMVQAGHRKFLVFSSSDIEWVKENVSFPYAEYVTKDLFDHYEDWYDMCLMSHCRHNIIANSTFSWWGAWLNNHPDKMVICPKLWDNRYPNYTGYCCDGWIAI